MPASGFSTGNRDWNPQLVQQLILELKKSNQRFDCRYLHVNRGNDPDLLLSQIVGRATSRKDLHKMACQYFGSWSWALRESGISQRRSSHNHFWNRFLIVKSIQHLSAADFPLTVQSICFDKSKKTTELLREVVGRRTTGSGLHDAARRYFGSWDMALRASGLDVETIKEKPFWTKGKMISAIQALYSSGIPLNSSSMQADETSRTIKIIQKKIGKGRSGRSLIGAAYRTFGSWDRALMEANLKPTEFRSNRFAWNKQTLRKVLKEFSKAKIPLNASSIAKNTDTSTKGLILKTTGRRVQGRRIYRAVQKRLGSWDEILKYSGFVLSSIRKKSAPCEQSKDSLIEYIQTLYEHDLELNCTSMIKKTKIVQFCLEKNFGRPISGISLMNTAKKIFGTWDKALWESGLDPGAIRLTLPRHSTNLPVVLYQVEDIKMEGIRRRVKVLGAPPKTPDQLLEEKQASKTLASAVNLLNQEDRNLTEKIFDAILKVHHYKNQEQLVKFIGHQLRGSATEEQIKSIFKQLVRNIDRNGI